MVQGGYTKSRVAAFLFALRVALWQDVIQHTPANEKGHKIRNVGLIWLYYICTKRPIFQQNTTNLTYLYSRLFFTIFTGDTAGDEESTSMTIGLDSFPVITQAKLATTNVSTKNTPIHSVVLILRWKQGKTPTWAATPPIRNKQQLCSWIPRACS